MTDIMTSLTSYQFEGRTVRTSMTEIGDPLFVAADVCGILEIANTTDALKGLEPDEVHMITLASSEGIRGNPNVNAVTESGLYALIFASRKPEAKRFRKWVTAEVLPAIRKHGIYRMASVSTMRQIDKLKLRLEAAELRAKAQALEAIARGDRARPEDGGVTDRPVGWLTVPEFVAAKLPKTDPRYEGTLLRLGWRRELRKAVVGSGVVKARTGNSVARRVFRPDLLENAWVFVAADIGLDSQLPGMEA
jgi:prophage antirepressor-like protein